MYCVPSVQNGDHWRVSEYTLVDFRCQLKSENFCSGLDRLEFCLTHLPVKYS
jgi:hypothetical protein